MTFRASSNARTQRPDATGIAVVLPLLWACAFTCVPVFANQATPITPNGPMVMSSAPPVTSDRSEPAAESEPATAPASATVAPRFAYQIPVDDPAPQPSDSDTSTVSTTILAILVVTGIMILGLIGYCIRELRKNPES